MDNVGIFLFDNIELLDFAGPYEVFSVTAELNDNRLFKVFTLSVDGRPVKTVNGLTVVPDFSLDDHPPVDILVVPGGAGTKAEMAKPAILDWLSKAHEAAKITMSVCSGTRLLGVLGLLDHLESTTHHEVIADMRKISPRTIIREDQRFVDNGKIMTSGGISAGIDLSLHIVRKLHGAETAGRTTAYMEYGDWRNRK